MAATWVKYGVVGREGQAAPAAPEPEAKEPEVSEAEIAEFLASMAHESDDEPEREGGDEPPTGEEKTPHLQGYIQLAKQMRIGSVTEKLSEICGNHVHTLKARGDWAANHAYCTKEGDFFEWGTPVKKKGERTDITEFLTAAQTTDELVLAQTYPDAYAKYYKAAERVAALARDKREREGLVAEMEALDLHEWQVHCVEKLDGQSDRKVLWVVDEKGGAGKSTLAKWLMVFRGAFYVQGGKHSDIAEAWKQEEYVVFDFTRDKEDKISYSIIESFKNGLVFSPKYRSVCKKLAGGCKVVVFSNWHPDRSKLSADRWDVHCIPAETPFTIAKRTLSEARKSDAPEPHSPTESEKAYHAYEDAFGGFAQPPDLTDWDKADSASTRSSERLFDGSFIFEEDK